MKKGFSKIVILVVVVVLIAGIYTVVKYSSTNAEVDKTEKIKEVNTAYNVAKLCVNKGYKVSAPEANKSVCSQTVGSVSNSKWPTLPSGWSYDKTSSFLAVSTMKLLVNTDDKKIECTKACIVK
jgi:Na+-transporting NADH:ubiquinone oxidoreductase subunit NqrF